MDVERQRRAGALGWLARRLGLRPPGLRRLGLRRLGAAAAGAIVGGTIASSAYYGGYPYYDGGFAYDSCPPSYGYGGYSPAYPAYPYRGYYSGW